MISCICLIIVQLHQIRRRGWRIAPSHLHRGSPRGVGTQREDAVVEQLEAHFSDFGQLLLSAGHRVSQVKRLQRRAVLNALCQRQPRATLLDR